METENLDGMAPVDAAEMVSENEIDNQDFSDDIFAVRKTVLRFTNPALFIKRIRENKMPHVIRKSSECTEIIMNGTKIFFRSVKNFPSKKLFLFQSVKRDVIKWLGNRTDISLPPASAHAKYNYDYDDSYGKLAAADLNHAYWRIAYVKGMISEKTYHNGLVTDDHEIEGKIKALRLATLSVLGRKKVFEEYDDTGTVVAKHITQQENPLQKKVFEYIRQYCYHMMHELSERLGPDFESWKVDCIYFRDTPENRKLVEDYLLRRNMSFKILDWFENNE